MIRSLQTSMHTLVIAALASAFMTASAMAADKDTDAVLAANAKYYAALNKIFAGDATAMKDVWSHKDDVFYMGPTGKFDRGWTAVLKGFEAESAMKLGGKVEPADIKTVVGKDMAVISKYDQGENKNAKGEVERVKLRATSVFRKEGGQWKMVGHQTDTLPYLAK